MIEKTYPIAEKLLNNGLLAAQKLLELLNIEFRQLQQKTDPEALSLTAFKKKEMVAQLEQFSKQFGQVLATEQLVISHGDIKNYLIKAKAAGFNVAEAWGCWRRIAEISQQCQTINEQNGASIAILARHTERSLQILRGKSQVAATYGPDGVTRNELFSYTSISV